MTIERIGGPAAVSSVAGSSAASGAASTARSAMATVGERILAWTAASSGGKSAAGQWSAGTGVASSGFSPDRAELSRGGDVYGLRSLTSEISQNLGATPAQEGALGRAIEDFARGAALHFNGRAGGENMVDDVADALSKAVDSGTGDGVDGVTSRIEIAARKVETLNR